MPEPVELHSIWTHDGVYYPLNDDTSRFVLTTTPGNLGLPPIEFITERRYKQDGVKEVAYRLEARHFYLTHRFETKSREEVFARRTELLDIVRPNRAIYPDTAPALITYIFATEDGTVQRALQGRTLTPRFEATDPETWDEFAFEYVLEIECWEPSLYDPDEQSFSVPSAAATELAFPIDFPIWFEDNNIIASGAVPYVGNWYSYPILRVTGPCTSFTVTHEELDKHIYFLGAVIPGEVVEVDLYNRTVTSDVSGDRFAELGPLSDLQAFRLEPTPVVPQNTILFYAPGSSSILASYDSSNQTEDPQLRGYSAAGGTTTSSPQTGTGGGVGDVGTGDAWQGQSFQVTGGQLSQFSFILGVSGGAPVGRILWDIRTDNAGAPSTTSLANGAMTPTASATNTVNIAEGPILISATTYWLVLHVETIQVAGNYWLWRSQNPGTYPDGNRSTSVGGVIWTPNAQDFDFTLITSAIVVNDELAQSFQLANDASIGSVTLLLKKTGTPSGTLTFRLETDSGGTPSGTLVDPAATDTLAESSLTTAYSTYTFEFSSGVALVGSLTYWLVLETDRAASNTNYVEWGAGTSNDYADGQLMGSQASTWTPLSMDGVFQVIAETTVGLVVNFLNRYIGI